MRVKQEWLVLEEFVILLVDRDKDRNIAFGSGGLVMRGEIDV